MTMFRLALHRSLNGTSKAWVLPSGCTVHVPARHWLWLVDHAAEIRDRFGLKVPTTPEASEHSVRLWAIRQSFVRVNLAFRINLLTVELVDRYRNSPAHEAALQLIEDNRDDLSALTINYLADNGSLVRQTRWRRPVVALTLNELAAKPGGSS